MKQKILNMVVLFLVGVFFFDLTVSGYAYEGTGRIISNTGGRFLEIDVRELGRVRRDRYLPNPKASQYEEGLDDLHIKGKLIGELFYWGTNLVITSFIYRTSERDFRESVEAIKSRYAAVATRRRARRVVVKKSSHVVDGLKWDAIEIRWVPRLEYGEVEFFVVNMYARRDNIAYAIQYSVNHHYYRPAIAMKDDYISPEEFLRYVRVHR